MIKRFFQALNSEEVLYLLISGQATVLYGAATFSEDIDIWVNPTPQDWNKLLKVIRRLKGKVYKLTPPLRMDLIRKGHGYHFQFQQRGNLEWFLDVMGKPPRVGDFISAFKKAVYHRTEWGRIPVIGIRELVEIKKTRRLEDYPVISNLVRIEYNNLHPSVSFQDWEWILKNTFEIEDVIYYLSNHRRARAVVDSLKRKCLTFVNKALIEKRRKEFYIKGASKQIALEIEELREKDRVYWQPIIEELRRLKREGELLPENDTPPLSVC